MLFLLVAHGFALESVPLRSSTRLGLDLDVVKSPMHTFKGINGALGCARK